MDDRTTCALCGLPAGRSPVTKRLGGEERDFCCLGCMHVYAILLESGALVDGLDPRETDLFKRSLALGLVSTTAERPPARPVAVEIPPDAPVRETLLQVSGMWCPSCAWVIEHTLLSEPGVVSAECFFTTDLVKVSYSPLYVPPERVARAVERLGYRATEYDAAGGSVDAERRDLVLRLGVSGFLWINIMTLSTALYVGYFERISESVSRYLPLVLMGLATPVVFYSAMPILRRAWGSVANRAAQMETLLAVGILAAYVYSSIQAVRGETHVYFDTASAIVTLVLVGKLIERSAKERTTRSITMLYRMMPKKARVAEGGTERFVPVDALAPGDMFVVKAGETIPADGVVVEGTSHADESLLTGESAPVAKAHGSPVVAGSVNAGGVLKVSATRVGGDATLARIIKLVEQAVGGRSAIERAVDRVSRVFVPAVIALAAATFLVVWLGGYAPAGEALMRAITILVIACPCALGMATPLAITSAVGAASRMGVLVGDSRALEAVRRVDTVVFDKTGTITEGVFSVLEVGTLAEAAAQPGAAGTGARAVAADAAALNATARVLEHEALSLVGAIERYSEHPLGRAVVERAASEGIEPSEAGDVRVHGGRGISGVVSGREVWVGNRALAAELARPLAAHLDAKAREWEERGCTSAFFGWGGEARGFLAFGDRVKPDAADVVSEMKRRGMRVVLVSGDTEETTRWAAEAVGATDFVAGALPERKVEVVGQLRDEGAVVAMIGDGINDAPALARADLGVAMGSGTDVAMRAAVLVLMSGSLRRVLDAFDLARRTWRVVRQNLFWAFFYNVAGITLAVTGVLNPILAAGAMLLSSLSVIGNSLRLGGRGAGG